MAGSGRSEASWGVTSAGRLGARSRQAGACGREGDAGRGVQEASGVEDVDDDDREGGGGPNERSS